jgi:hypothetical protein
LDGGSFGILQILLCWVGGDGVCHKRYTTVQTIFGSVTGDTAKEQERFLGFMDAIGGEDIPPYVEDKAAFAEDVIDLIRTERPVVTAYMQSPKDRRSFLYFKRCMAVVPKDGIDTKWPKSADDTFKKLMGKVSGGKLQEAASNG